MFVLFRVQSCLYGSSLIFFLFWDASNSESQANTQKKIMSYMKESQLEIVGPNR